MEERGWKVVHSAGLGSAAVSRLLTSPEDVFMIMQILVWIFILKQQLKVSLKNKSVTGATIKFSNTKLIEKKEKKSFEFRKEGNDTINIFMMSCDDKRNYLLFFFYSFWMVCVHSLMFSWLWFMNSTLLRSFHEIVFACVKSLLLEICKDLYMSAFSKGTY